MAQRRMFSRRITDTDHFLDMPLSAQCLYFHLNMEADDDGFIGNAKTIRRKVGASEDDLKLLIAKQFILPFETSSVVVVRDWRIHNYIQKDRYNRTLYQEERQTLGLDKNGIYHKLNSNVPGMYTSCIQNGDTGKVRLERGKSIDRDIYSAPDEPAPHAPLVNEVELIEPKKEEPKKKVKQVKHKHGEYNNVLLTDEELEKLKAEYSDLDDRIERLSSYIASTGKAYKSHYATIRNWARKDKEQPKQQVRYNQPRAEVVPDWLGKQYKEQTAPSGGYHNPFAEKEG